LMLSSAAAAIAVVLLLFLFPSARDEGEDENFVKP